MQFHTGGSNRGRGATYDGRAYPTQPASEPADAAADDDDDDDDDDDEWDDGEEDDEFEPEAAPTRGLFSAQEFASPAECLADAASAHGLDVQQVIGRLRLDLYGRMKLVNYLRTSVSKPGADAAALVAAVNACVPGAPSAWPWSDDAYLQPALPDDPLLYSLTAEDADEEAAEDDAVDAVEAVGALHETVALMRQEMKAVLNSLDDATPGGRGGGGSGGSGGGGASSSTAPAAGDSDASAAAKPADASVSSSSSSSAVATKEGPSEGEYGSRDGAESSYFDSYARVGIHEEMLRDTVRTEGYRDAIQANAALLQGKVVLDVGCGTGILSLFAARAGAKLVIGVDASPIVESARKIVAANGFADRVVLVQGTLETLEALPLPDGIEKVDVIISEWMGYLLLYESMLPSVLFARDRWLKPAADGGVLLPSSCAMHVGASSHDRLGFWGDVYGFDFGALRDEVRERSRGDASVEVVPAASLLSGSAPFASFELATTRDAELDFSNVPFALSVTAAGTLRCFVVHFDTTFDCSGVAGGAPPSSFSTGPTCTPTHWKQTTLYLHPPREVRVGDKLSGTISCARQKEYKRAYDVSLTYALNGAECGTQLWRL